MQLISEVLFRKGDTDSLQLSSLLIFQWHMLGRSIDSCWLIKSQLQIMSGGELFVRFTRLKTSTLQGISMHSHKSAWKLCPLMVVLVTTTFPSPLGFNLFRTHKIELELEGNSADMLLGAVSQLEGAVGGAVDESLWVEDVADSSKFSKVTRNNESGSANQQRSASISD